LLNQSRQLLLSLGLDLVPERLFHSAAFLHIAGLEQIALLLIQ
jgi:hypothetical protein